MMIDQYVLLIFVVEIWYSQGNEQNSNTSEIKISQSIMPDDLYSNNENVSSNFTFEDCSNDYCLSDADYMDMIFEHLYPTTFEWVLIFMHTVTFVVGLVGNALVCIAVYKNRLMRNVTNYFIVNLAVADFMVILFCLPPTVVWDITETWFLGTALCKIVLYFQTVSVAVSVLTLTFISVDRWYAICFPLKFKSTTTRAKISIIIIWIVSLLIDIPELIVLETIPRQTTNINMHFFTQCNATWQKNYEVIYQISKIILLYTVPLLFISVAYCQIVRVLWTSGNIPGHTETLIMTNNTGLYHHGAENHRRLTMGNTNESQLRSRRKAAKMLVAVVIMFALCYFPVHLLNILRITIELTQNDFTSVISNLTHWLRYVNSAINPIIYNFMSGKFRREFKRAFQQCHDCSETERKPDVDLVSQNDYAHSLNRRTSQSFAFSSRRTKTTSFITHAT